MSPDAILGLAAAHNVEPDYRGYVSPDDLISFARAVAAQCASICENMGSTVSTAHDCAADIRSAFA